MRNRYIILLVLMFYSCTSTYNETIHYTAYYDDAKTIKKVEGVLFNGEEVKEWIFYSRNGEIVERGNYDNGLPHGVWQYNLPGVDSIIYWGQKELDSFEFSIPSTFGLYEPMCDSATTAFRDTLNHTILGISVIENCDQKCFNGYHNFNLEKFKNSNINVPFAESQIVNSKSGTFYLDEFDLRREDYSSDVKEYMAYKPIDNNRILVITIVNKNIYKYQLKFLIGEIFFHFRYNSNRIAFPYDEIQMHTVDNDQW